MRTWSQWGSTCFHTRCRKLTSMTNKAEREFKVILDEKWNVGGNNGAGKKIIIINHKNTNRTSLEWWWQRHEGCIEVQKRTFWGQQRRVWPWPSAVAQSWGSSDTSRRCTCYRCTCSAAGRGWGDIQETETPQQEEGRDETWSPSTVKRTQQKSLKPMRLYNYTQPQNDPLTGFLSRCSSENEPDHFRMNQIIFKWTASRGIFTRL